MQKKVLTDIAIIRPLCILSIVIGHSFAIYSGVWEKPGHILDVTFYQWINPFFISFQLQAFVFVSGYLFGYQTITLGRKDDPKKFIAKKFKRIYLPCLLFGLLYYLLFEYAQKDYSLIDSLLVISNGVGHLWFLPMIFACYIVAYYTTNILMKKPFWIILLAGLLLFVSPLVPNVFGISSMMSYLLYFYLGYLYVANKNLLTQFLSSYRNVLIITLLFLISFGLFYFIKYSYEPTMVLKVILFALKVPLSVLGILSLFGFVNKYLVNRNTLSKVFLYLNDWSYGIYVVHQFVLVWLIDFTSLSEKVSSFVFPFYILIITLSVTSLIVISFLKTKVGRYLIG
ncbi:acyltransferase family protein [Marinifilum sp. D737]|uniref:acyltransferase family protein n=1 Tax=Marinifilum sp. D737 TaxID=2969628 RepID=UPI00227552A4|nr:acyltransferase [Marinifilum sp. D737]MCY1634890.1 acyltransferase [Marinifilum sp. D737]